MAKFSNIFQLGTGKIGTHYLRKAKNSQGRAINVLGTINYNPTNPKTNSQMLHRARFANAVKFYKRATKNFFRFAYEDKKANESDYNAFMRHNINVALPMVKAQVDNAVYPSLGSNWLMSSGSLNSVGVNADSNGRIVLDLAPESKSIADMSKALVNLGFLEGDIVTLVCVKVPTKFVAGDGLAKLTTADVVAYASQVGIVPAWSIGQFIINTSATDTDYPGQWGSENPFDLVTIDDTTKKLVFENYTGIMAAAFIVSRKNDSGLLCSTSFLIPNGVMAAAIRTINTDSYISNVLLTWQAKDDDAILKGSVANNTYTGGSSSSGTGSGTGSGSGSGTGSGTGGSTTTSAATISSVNGDSALPVVVENSVDNVPLESTAFTLKGTHFQSAPLQESDFTVSGSAKIDSLTITSDTTATLNVSATTGKSVGGVYFGKTQIIRISSESEL